MLKYMSQTYKLVMNLSVGKAVPGAMTRLPTRAKAAPPLNVRGPPLSIAPEDCPETAVMDINPLKVQPEMSISLEQLFSWKQTAT